MKLIPRYCIMLCLLLAGCSTKSNQAWQHTVCGAGWEDCGADFCPVGIGKIREVPSAPGCSPVVRNGFEHVHAAWEGQIE